jgi:hypothetical protein
MVLLFRIIYYICKCSMYLFLIHINTKHIFLTYEEICIEITIQEMRSSIYNHIAMDFNCRDGLVHNFYLAHVESLKTAT